MDIFLVRYQGRTGLSGTIQGRRSTRLGTIQTIQYECRFSESLSFFQQRAQACDLVLVVLLLVAWQIFGSLKAHRMTPGINNTSRLGLYSGYCCLQCFELLGVFTSWGTFAGFSRITGQRLFSSLVTSISQLQRRGNGNSWKRDNVPQTTCPDASTNFEISWSRYIVARMMMDCVSEFIYEESMSPSV